MSETVSTQTGLLRCQLTACVDLAADVETVICGKPPTPDDDGTARSEEVALFVRSTADADVKKAAGAVVVESDDEVCCSSILLLLLLFLFRYNTALLWNTVARGSDDDV